MQILQKCIRLTIIILATSIVSVSCEKMPTEILLKNNSRVVPGDLKDYLEVVDGNYKYEYLKEESRGILTVKLKVVKQLNLDNYNIDFINGQYLDEAGVPISVLYDFKVCKDYDSENKDEIKNLLKQGTGEIFVKTPTSWDYEKKQSKIVFQKAKSFIITNSKISEKKIETSKTDTNYENSDNEKITDTDNEVKSNTNWDKILNDYEKVVDKYVIVAKRIKADPTDMSALTDYTNLMQESMSLQEKLNGAASDLSVSQASRLAKIAAKMLEAAY